MTKLNSNGYQTIYNQIDRLCINKDESIDNEDFILTIFQMNGDDISDNPINYQTEVITTLYDSHGFMVWEKYPQNIDFENMDLILQISGTGYFEQYIIKAID